MEYREILIVDDSSTSRMIIRRCFEIAGYSRAKFIYAENGLDALAELQKNHSIDLLLTDLNMPGMDGVNLIRNIRLLLPGISLPVIVISSTGDSSVDKELLDAGVKAIIKKPVSPDKVVKTMGGLI